MIVQLWWIKAIVVILYILILSAFAIQYLKTLSEIRTNMMNIYSKLNCFQTR